MEYLTPAELYEIPALPPPPGVVSNFVNPETRSPLVIAITVICLALMWPIFVLRIYTKIWLTRNFGWDDASSITAIILTTCYSAAVIWIMGVLGPHGWNVRYVALTPELSELLVGVTELFYGPAAFFAKLAIFLLYLRTFGPSKWMRWLSYFGIAANFAFYFASTFAFGYLCVRRPGQTWLQDQDSPRCIIDTHPLNYVVGIFGIVSDIFIFVLPLPVIWNLQMPTRRKIGVTAIFATGLVAIVASIIGLYVRIEDVIGNDSLWYLPPALLLAVVELSVGVTCGCMPYLASFFRQHSFKMPMATSLRNLFTRGSSRSGSKRSTETNLKSFDRVSSNPSEHKPYVETQVLGSMKGDGHFLQSGNFDNQRWERSSMQELKSQDVPTHRDVLE